MLPFDKEVVVLDAGFSSQLSRHVKTQIDGHPLWTSRFTLTDKEAVINTHLDFLKAGADLITTNTYQASVNSFMTCLNLSEEDSYGLIKESVNLARTALERYKAQHPNDESKRLIVGSVGPYGAYLHDGSEYTGAYSSDTPSATIKEWHLPRLKALVEAGVDLIAFETIPCKAEAATLVELVKDFPDVKAWLSFSCKDGSNISNGDNFQESVRYCYDSNPQQLVAVGANCISPEIVEPLFKDINKGRSKENRIPLIVYPNSGETYSKEGWVGKEVCTPLASFAQKWVKELGVTWIGGCCRTYAEDISQIKENVKKLGENKD